MVQKPRPQCRAVVLCDVIYRDERSKKLILVGTFNNIKTLEVPCTHTSLSLYLAMNEGAGDYTFKIAIEHVASQQKIFETSGDIKFEDPNQVVEINAPINGLTFANDGKYEVQVWTDDDMIGQTTFSVNRVRQG